MDRVYGVDLLVGVKGLCIVVVFEGFGWVNFEIGVDQVVCVVVVWLDELGVCVDECLIFLYCKGYVIWIFIVIEGMVVQMEGLNYGLNWKGFYVISLMWV